MLDLFKTAELSLEVAIGLACPGSAFLLTACGPARMRWLEACLAREYGTAVLAHHEAQLGSIFCGLCRPDCHR